MKSQEALVTPDSNYFIYTPSVTAKKIYFYPIHIGNFEYEPGYQISRTNFDSFLLMLILEGSCTVTLNGQTAIAKKGVLY